jgi:transposase
MRLHRNARTCPASRRLLVDRIVVERWPVSVAAAAAGVSVRTAAKWLRRYRDEGVAGLEDRSSAPHRCRAGLRLIGSTRSRRCVGCG